MEIKDDCYKYFKIAGLIFEQFEEMSLKHFSGNVRQNFQNGWILKFSMEECWKTVFKFPLVQFKCCECLKVTFFTFLQISE